MSPNDFENQTLEELENDYWPSLSKYPSIMIKEIYLIRKKKIIEMDSNDIRLLIDQGVGLEFLVPKAIKFLQMNVLEEALYYPGDLLLAVLRIKKNYWNHHPLEKGKITELITERKISITETTEIYDKKILQSIISEINEFCNLSN